jgi:iron(III) transport system substrate-binding protein
LRVFLGRRFLLLSTFIVIALQAVLATACGGDDSRLTIYAGRSQNLVQPLLEQFSKDTGIKIQVRYGDGTDLALAILEEGGNSPADVYYGQDVGALGALNAEGRLSELPASILDSVGPAFRSPDGLWVGISGRQRVIVYNTDDIDPATLPPSVLGYTDPEWRGRLGVVPRSDGFPEFVTALRLTRGDDFARQWLTDLNANQPIAYPNNIAAIQAVANGEIDVAFLNHYYLFRFLEEEGEDFKARNYYFTNGDIGGLFLVASAGILDSTKHREEAERFIEYMLSPAAQQYFTDETHEYPLVTGVDADPELQPLSEIDPPEIDLSDLTDLEGSLEMMRETGILP